MFYHILGADDISNLIKQIKAPTFGAFGIPDHEHFRDQINLPTTKFKY